MLQIVDHIEGCVATDTTTLQIKLKRFVFGIPQPRTILHDNDVDVLKQAGLDCV